MFPSQCVPSQFPLTLEKPESHSVAWELSLPRHWQARGCAAGAVWAPARHPLFSVTGKAECWDLPACPRGKGRLACPLECCQSAGASAGSSAGTVILSERYEGTWGVRVGKVFSYPRKATALPFLLPLQLSSTRAKADAPISTAKV